MSEQYWDLLGEREPGLDNRRLYLPRGKMLGGMLEAARQPGHEHNPDFNGVRQEGVGRFQLTQRGGLRCSTADAFLRPPPSVRTWR